MLPVDLEPNPDSVFQLDNLGLDSSLKTCLMIWPTLFAVTGPVLLTLLRCHGKVPSSGRALPCLLCSRPQFPGIETCIQLPSYKKLHFGAVLQFTYYQFVLPLRPSVVSCCGTLTYLCLHPNYEVETFIFRYHGDNMKEENKWTWSCLKWNCSGVLTSKQTGKTSAQATETAPNEFVLWRSWIIQFQ